MPESQARYTAPHPQVVQAPPGSRTPPASPPPAQRSRKREEVGLGARIPSEDQGTCNKGLSLFLFGPSCLRGNFLHGPGGGWIEVQREAGSKGRCSWCPRLLLTPRTPEVGRGERQEGG